MNPNIKKNLDSMSTQDLLDFYYDYDKAMAEGFNGTPLPSDYPRFKNKHKYPKHIASWNELDWYVREVKGLA